jgi:hypothetical protein
MGHKENITGSKCPEKSLLFRVCDPKLLGKVRRSTDGVKALEILQHFSTKRFGMCNQKRVMEASGQVFRPERPSGVRTQVEIARIGPRHRAGRIHDRRLPAPNLAQNTGFSPLSFDHRVPILSRAEDQNRPAHIGG